MLCEVVREARLAVLVHHQEEVDHSGVNPGLGVAGFDLARTLLTDLLLDTRRGHRR